MIYDAGRRTVAARIGAVDLRVFRGRVLRFNAEGPDGLTDYKAPGQRLNLNDELRSHGTKFVFAAPKFIVLGIPTRPLPGLSGESTA